MNEFTMRQRLAEANTSIADTEARIARQGEIIAECFAGGDSTEVAEKRFVVLNETLKVMQERKEGLLAKLRHKEI